MGLYYSVNHLQDLGLHKLEILGVARWRAANDIVNSAVIVLSAHATCQLSAQGNIGREGERGLPRSMALENLTKTECFFIMRWMC